MTRTFDDVGSPRPEAGPEAGPEVGPRRPAPRPATALARLGLVVVAGILAAVLTHATDLLVVILAIVAMIMLHELGHFATAKWSGMKVTEYFLGFGPRVWSVRWGETEYGVKAIPAGGYVKIVGMSNLEQVAEADEPRTYRQAPFGRRLLVAVAGSAVHMILALGLLWAIFAVIGVSGSRVSVGALSHLAGGPGPAQQAGLRAGDVFVSVDGRQVSNADQLVKLIETHSGVTLQVVVERGGRRVSLAVTPVDARRVRLAGGQSVLPPGSPGRPDGIIGVELAMPPARVNPVLAVGRATGQIGTLVGGTAAGIVHIFSPHGLSSFAGQVTGGTPANSPGASSDRVTSILGAVNLATQAAQAGVAQLLYVLAAINVFIGLFNMIPLLPLDGGHVAIAVYERLRSRPGRRYRADVAKLLPATYVVILFLVVLGASALYLDITRPIANPFR